MCNLIEILFPIKFDDNVCVNCKFDVIFISDEV